MYICFGFCCGRTPWVGAGPREYPDGRTAIYHSASQRKRRPESAAYCMREAYITKKKKAYRDNFLLVFSRSSRTTDSGCMHLCSHVRLLFQFSRDVLRMVGACVKGVARGSICMHACDAALHRPRSPLRYFSMERFGRALHWTSGPPTP